MSRAGRRASRLPHGLTLALATAVTTAAMAEQPFAGWSLFGSNTLRLETYNDSGDTTASPYPYTGGQHYNELALDFEKQNSRYDFWRGQFYGVVNASDYRARDRGAVPERMSLWREDGDGALPYRAQVGDYFGYYSYLTLQRSLKGLQVELQPHVDAAGRRHSIVFSTGAIQSSWVDFAPNEDITTGASWLIDGRTGGLSVNFVSNHRDADRGIGALARDQYTFSVAGETSYQLTTQLLVFEGELAHLLGDRDAAPGSTAGEDRDGNGAFVELRGADLRLPLDYRARIEYYDEDFQPRAGVITPDRRSVEFHSGWRFGSGLRLSARVQGFEDGFDSSNPQNTRTIGVNLAGPLMAHRLYGLTGSADVFAQRLDDEDDNFDLRLVTANLNLYKPLPYEWYGRLAIFLQDVDDRNAADVDVWTGQYHLSADHVFNVGLFNGVVTPGLLYRHIDDGAAATDDWSPTVGLSFTAGAHAVGFNYGFLQQDRHFLGAGDVDTHTVAFDYRYTRQRHMVGVDMSLFERGVEPGRDTEAWRVGVYWTYSFERPASAAVAGGAPGFVPAGPLTADLVALAPGADLAAARAALQSAGIAGGTTQGNLVIHEYALMRQITERQRLVLMHEGGQLDGSALVIDLDAVGNVDSVMQTFERVRKALIDLYGGPGNNFEQGDFSPALVADVNAQRFIRVTEWSTPAGVLRLGIPRRLDGQVRIEIQHRRGFPSPRDTLWSLDTVR